MIEHKIFHRVQTNVMKHFIWHRLNLTLHHYNYEPKIGGYPDFNVNEISSTPVNTGRMAYKCTSK